MNETHETQTLPTQPEPTSFWRKRSTLAVGGGIAAAALLVGGVGIGSAIADDEDDSAASSPAPTAVSPAASSAPADDRSDDEAAPEYGSADAATLSDVVAAAVAVEGVDGRPTSLEAQRDGGWSVDVETSAGDETTVLVPASGRASVVRTERADADDRLDPAPVGTLSAKNLTQAVEAALGEAEGVVTEVDVDDDPREAYTVTVLGADGVETEVDLSSDFRVTQVDVDRD